MRHSPFGTLPPLRRATADMPVGEYTIPMGACILFNLYAVFHDPSYWGDAEVFRPDRFFDDTGTQLDPVKVGQIAKFGFGTASRT